MSRSFKKTIAFGKSTNGGQARCAKTWGDYAAEKARKEGTPIHKQHYRHHCQTLEDYKNYVRDHFYVDMEYGNDMFDRRRWKQYLKFLDGREETEELIEEFATKLFNKDKSK